MLLHNEQGNRLVLFDRSRVETALECSRRYYWAYGYLGLGIKRAKQLPEWELATGTYCHEGVEMILRGIPGRQAAEQAQAMYRDDIGEQLAQLELGERRELVMREYEQQLDLVAALVYGWSLIGYPRYVANYQIIDIEREEHIGYLIGDTEVRLLARADIIGRSLASKQLVIHNFKTTSDPSEQWRQSFAIDMQTLTERVATEDRVEEQVLGVVIEGLVKGKKSEYPKGSGFWQHGSPLIYIWADKQDGTQLPGEARGFYSRYEWTCTNPHILGNGKKCMGGKNHRLGQGVYKVRAASDYPGGIFSWIDWLNANDRELLEQQFISLPPIGRAEYDVERWKRQVLMAEQYRQVTAEDVDKKFLANDKQNAYELLDYHFPQHSGRNCLYPRQCSYYDLCHSAADPFDAGMWQPRVPNHAEEAELIQIEVAKQC